MPALPDSSSVEADDTFEHWHHVTCRNYAVSEFRRQSDNPFNARIAFRAFGQLALTDASSDMGAAQLIRGTAEIRRDPCDHFMLFLVTGGEIGVVQEDREARAQAGDLFLYDETRPLILDFDDRYQTIMLNIPRLLLEARLPKTRAFTARRIVGNSKLGALAGTVIRQLVGFDDRTRPGVIDRIGASTLDIVATALDAETASEPLAHSGRHRLLGKAETYLLANLHDSRLDIDTVASALHMAPRTLNRVFATEGTTPMRWLWQQRLAASNRALAEGRIKSVTDASLSFGFSDVSHFSRAFKMAFGTPPRALKQR